MASQVRYRLCSRADPLHAGVMAIFDKWGVDRDGVISRDDVLSVLQAVVPQAEQVDDFLGILDFDDNGEIEVLDLTSQASIWMIFWDPGNTSDGVKGREKWAADVRAAQELPESPAWVKGQRPSSELIANYSNDGWDTKPEPGPQPEEDAVTGMRGENRLQRLKGRVLGLWAEHYELPATFTPQLVDANGVPCVWANWPGIGEDSGVILNFHGGGGETIDANINMCARLSCITGRRVLTVHWRYAPEFPMPVATEDCLCAYRWLMQTTASDKIAISGDSSGGMLVMTVLQAIISEGLQVPACALPISAWNPHVGNKGCWYRVAGNRGFFGELRRDPPLTYEEIAADPRFNFLVGDFQGLARYQSGPGIG